MKTFIVLLVVFLTGCNFPLYYQGTMSVDEMNRAVKGTAEAMDLAIPVPVENTQLPASSSIQTLIIPTLISTLTPTLEYFPPASWPENLDEVWYSIEDGKPGWIFESCSPGQLTKPFITWNMLKEGVLSEPETRQHPYIVINSDDVRRIIKPGGGKFYGKGLITVHEDEVFKSLIVLVTTSMWMCDSEGTGKPTLYGEGVQIFLDWLSGFAEPEPNG